MQRLVSCRHAVIAGLGVSELPILYCRVGVEQLSLSCLYSRVLSFTSVTYNWLRRRLNATAVIFLRAFSLARQVRYVAFHLYCRKCLSLSNR